MSTGRRNGCGLLAFPLFLLAFWPFGVTFIATEPAAYPHTPDLGLAFLAEAGWIVLLALAALAVRAVRARKGGPEEALKYPRDKKQGGSG